MYKRQGDSATYHLRLDDSHIRPVSKATYDALTGVPETMSATDRSRLELDRARAAEDRVQRHFDLDEWRKVRQRIDRAEATWREDQATERARYDSLREASRARIADLMGTRPSVRA